MQRSWIQRAASDGVRLGLPTVGLSVVLVGTAAFAAGQALSPESPPALSSSASPAAMPMETPPPPEEVTEPLPPGHPPVDTDQAGVQMAVRGATTDQKAALEWRAPDRWQLVPNANSMRMATYRVPRQPGDAVDPELSVTQAGGSVEANAERWIAQFGPAGQSTAERSTRKVGPLEVTVVEAQGDYSGGMTKVTAATSGWALVGAIVATPGMPHFFKLTGPAKSVLAARAEFDAMIATVALR